MFSFIKHKLQQLSTGLANRLQSFFSTTTINEESLDELEKILISADTGPKTARHITASLKKQLQAGTVKEGTDLKQALKQQLLQLLPPSSDKQCSLYLLVGVNGSGKTTFAGKLAHRFAQQNKRVVLVAADTFRAAAPEQLQEWAHRAGAELIIGKAEQDPASVVFQACGAFKIGAYDTMIIDTAGRLQTKVNLMKELEKIKRVITQQLPHVSCCTLLTIDAMLGQNSLEQARLFNQATTLDGLVLTKMDGTGKGGIVFALNQELGVPVMFISYGEKIDNIREFEPAWYVDHLVES